MIIVLVQRYGILLIQFSFVGVCNKSCSGDNVTHTIIVGHVVNDNATNMNNEGTTDDLD